MPTLPSALVMDGENYLHPEGPQLDSSLFSVASSNMEVCYWILFVTFFYLLHMYTSCAYSHMNIFYSFIAMSKCNSYLISPFHISSQLQRSNKCLKLYGKFYFIVVVYCLRVSKLAWTLNILLIPCVFHLVENNTILLNVISIVPWITSAILKVSHLQNYIPHTVLEY